MTTQIGYLHTIADCRVLLPEPTKERHDLKEIHVCPKCGQTYRVSLWPDEINYAWTRYSGTILSPDGELL